MGELEKPFEALSDNAKEYFDLRVNEIKLQTTKGLSLAFSKFFGLLVILIVLMMVMLCAAFGGVLLLGGLIGNYAVGAFIVAGFFLIIAVVLFLFRKTLFLNQFVKLFIRIFYGE